jgi:hypothetical protein
VIYLIGSLRNPEIPKLANELREALDVEIFDDWYSAGPEADDYWRDHQKSKGLTFPQALQGLAARNVFRFDRENLERASAVILALPAGKSGHLELGWSVGGRGGLGAVPGYVLLDSPDRWDVMYQFATGVFDSKEALIETLRSGR